MGTTLHVEVQAHSRDAAMVAAQAATGALAEVLGRLSTSSADSELAALNRLPVGSSMRLSGPLLEDLRKVRRWSQATGGAFDPGGGALLDLYRVGVQGRWPSDAEVWSVLPQCGISQLHVVYDRAERRAARFCIDAEGFAKGAGLDAAAAALLAEGATRAVLDLGGQILCVAAPGNADPEPRDVAVAAPNDDMRAVIQVRVHSGSLATVANRQRNLLLAGRASGPILDPRTGRPARDFGSLTVWAKSAFAADCLSSGLFVMGPEAALRWAEQQDGIEVLVLETPRGTGAQAIIIARMTSGLRDHVAALVPGVRFE